MGGKLRLRIPKKSSWSIISSLCLPRVGVGIPGGAKGTRVSRVSWSDVSMLVEVPKRETDAQARSRVFPPFYIAAPTGEMRARLKAFAHCISLSASGEL